MSLTPLPCTGHSLTVSPHIIPLCNMEPHNLIPKTPSSQPHFNATYQNTIATCQNSNATQPNAGPAGSNLAVELHVDLTLLASGLDVSKRRMASIIAVRWLAGKSCGRPPGSFPSRVRKKRQQCTAFGKLGNSRYWHRGVAC